MKVDLKYFIGNKLCRLRYATQTLGGQVEADWFRVDLRRGLPNLCATCQIEVERYDHRYGADMAQVPRRPAAGHLRRARHGLPKHLRYAHGPDYQNPGRHRVVLTVRSGEGQFLKLNWFTFQK